MFNDEWRSIYKMYDYRLKKQLSLTDILSYEWIYHTSKDEILKAWDEYRDEISRWKKK